MSAFNESLALLRTRRFGTFCFASLLSNIGTWAQQVAEPWLLLTIGASSFVIGLDSFASNAPVWILTLVGGVLADRADRRRVIATFQSIQMLCPILIVVLLVTGGVQPWIVIALSLVVGVTDAVSMPSFQAIVPSIVRHEQIAAALALNATQFNLSRILGPALAGVIMASVGAIGCFALSAASYLPFIWVALWILPRGRAAPTADDSFDRHHPFAGIRDIARQPHLRGALLTVLLTSTLCGPLVIFCPVLVKDVLHGEASEFSLAIGAFGIGGLSGRGRALGDRCRSGPAADELMVRGRLRRDHGGRGAQSLVLGFAALAGARRRVDERLQHLGQLLPAGHRAGAVARPIRQPVHARHARRPLDRQPADRPDRERAGRARGSLDQWRSGAGRPNRRGTSMDSRPRAEGRQPRFNILRYWMRCSAFS